MNNVIRKVKLKDGVLTQYKNSDVIDVSQIKTANDFAPLSYFMSDNLYVEELNFKSLTSLLGGHTLRNMCSYCTNLKTVSFPELKELGYYELNSTFNSCTSLDFISFPKLEIAGNGSFSSTFQSCTNLTKISFPKLKKVSEGLFGSGEWDKSFDNCTNLKEIHFRKDMEEAIKALYGFDTQFGAENVVIFFDLVEINDEVYYEFVNYDDNTYSSPLDADLSGDLTKVYFKYDDIDNMLSLDLTTHMIYAYNEEGEIIGWMNHFESKSDTYYDKSIDYKSIGIQLKGGTQAEGKYVPLVKIQLLQDFKSKVIYTALDYKNWFLNNNTLPEDQYNLITEISDDGDNSLKEAFIDKDITGTVSFPLLETINSYGMKTAFNSCEGITSISFPTLKTIGDNGLESAFYNSGISGSIEFPNLYKVENGGLSSVFYACEGITSVSFPKLKNISNDALVLAFGQCENLTEIHFRYNMEEKIKALNGYDEKFGATNATIYFDLCADEVIDTKLKYVQYLSNNKCTPDGDEVTITGFDENYWGWGGYTYVTGIVDMPLLKSVISGSMSWSFNNCSNITGFSFPVLESIDKQGFRQAFSSSGLTGDLEFPSLTTIGQFGLLDAFTYCPNITSISFPALKTVDINGLYDMLYGCSQELTIYFPADMKETIENLSGYSDNFGATNGRIFFGDKSDDVTINTSEEYLNYVSSKNKLPSASQNKIIEINDDVLVKALYGNETLAGEVAFPELTSIGTMGLAGTFYGCTGITSISFPALESIGDEGLNIAFAQCSGLTGAIEFPSLTSVSSSSFDQAFWGCTGINEIHFKEDMKETIESLDGYDEKFGATNATIYFDNGVLYNATDYKNYIAKYNSLPYSSSNKITSIKSEGLYGAFISNTSLSGEASFPELESVGYYGMCSTFDGCTEITSISFPKLTSIGQLGFCSCFEGCSNITSVEFPSLVSLDKWAMEAAFYGCSKLETLYFPALIDIKSKYTFNNILVNCPNIKEVHFRKDMQKVIDAIGVFGCSKDFIICDLGEESDTMYEPCWVDMKITPESVELNNESYYEYTISDYDYSTLEDLENAKKIYLKKSDFDEADYSSTITAYNSDGSEYGTATNISLSGYGRILYDSQGIEYNLSYGQIRVTPSGESEVKDYEPYSLEKKVYEISNS
jgi:hypothetical protein